MPAWLIHRVGMRAKGLRALVVHVERAQGVRARGAAVAVRQRAQLLQPLRDRGRKPGGQRKGRC